MDSSKHLKKNQTGESLRPNKAQAGRERGDARPFQERGDKGRDSRRSRFDKEKGAEQERPDKGFERRRRPFKDAGRRPELVGRDGRSFEHGGHGRRNRGFATDEAAMSGWDKDPSKIPNDNISVQLAPRGFLATLLEELGERVVTVFGRLVVAKGRKPARWAQNVWLNPRWISVDSIGDAAKKLAAIQRNWRAHVPEEGGFARRSALIEEALPHVGSKPLEFGAPAPSAPMGAFVLWEKNLLLASDRTSSPFPDGVLRFVEDKTNPPGRAYLKLWETFTVTGNYPKPGELCLDLGASPGGWTWVLASLGCRVFALDKAPLADNVANMKNVEHCIGSGFALEPSVAGRVDWLCSDMICYPEKLFELVEKWMEAKAMAHAVCTLKFQSETDYKVIERFAAIPGSKIMHLSCNKHELTWIWNEEALLPS